MFFRAFLTIITAAVLPPRRNNTTLTITAKSDPAMLTKNSDEPLAAIGINCLNVNRPRTNLSGSFFP